MPPYPTARPRYPVWCVHPSRWRREMAHTGSGHGHDRTAAPARHASTV